MCFSAVVYAASGTYARKERVVGFVTSDSGSAKVMADSFVRVTNVLAKPGDLVEKGQPIVAVSNDTSLIGDNSYNQLAIANIQNQIAEIRNRQRISQDRFDAIRAEAVSDLDYWHAMVVSLNNQQETVSELFRIADRRYKDAVRVSESGALAKRDVDRTLEERLSQEQHTETISQRMLDAGRQVSQSKGKLKSISIEEQLMRSDANREVLALEEKLANLQGASESFVSAPRNGRIENIQVKNGTNVSPGDTLLSIVSESATYTATVYVPSRAIGFVEIGQDVRVMYEAFPHERYGVFPGKVTYVSSSTLSPNESGVELRIDEPVFKVDLSLENQVIKAHNTDYRLMDGMLLSAEIIMEDRSFLEWLLRPLLVRRYNEGQTGETT
jgi:membrane fusion protein